MIKVFHIISDSNIGGAGRYLLTYLRNCNRNEFEVTVAVPEGSQLLPEIQQLGFPCFEIEGMAEQSVSMPAVKQLRRLFKKQKPDIVHSHASLSARVAARLAGVKHVVYTRHSVFPQKQYLTNGVGKVLNGAIGGYLANGVIAVAGAAKKNLTDTGIDEKKIEVIYNGVDPLEEVPEQEKQEFREKLGIQPDEFVVAIIARLESVKGHRDFIDAADIVVKNGVKAKFVIAGTGTLQSDLKKYVKDKNLSDTVLFTGFLKNVSVLEHVMDIQVNASFGTEAASLALLEGMSIGKPAVVSDFGGNPELIQDGVNGYVVPKRRPAAMAEKILLLLQDEALREKLSENSKAVFEQKFTAKIMTGKMESFYKKLCGVKA